MTTSNNNSNRSAEVRALLFKAQQPAEAVAAQKWDETNPDYKLALKVKMNNPFKPGQECAVAYIGETCVRNKTNLRRFLPNDDIMRVLATNEELSLDDVIQALIDEAVEEAKKGNKKAALPAIS